MSGYSHALPNEKARFLLVPVSGSILKPLFEYQLSGRVGTKLAGQKRDLILKCLNANRLL
jgi:hypothetical protein